MSNIKRKLVCKYYNIHLERDLKIIRNKIDIDIKELIQQVSYINPFISFIKNFLLYLK